MKKIKFFIGIHQINSLFRFVSFFLVVGLGFFGIFYSVRAYPDVFKTEINFEKKENVSLNENLVFYFSIPIKLEGYENKIKIYPETNFKLRWEDSNKKLTIIPESFWKPDTEYRIFISEGRNVMFSNFETQEFFFYTEKYPYVSDFRPINGSRDILLTMEDPIIVNFDKTTKDFSIKFAFEPAQEISLESDIEKKLFKILPKDNLKDATKYNFKVFIKHKEESEKKYRQIYLSSFETPPPPVIVWEKDFALRLDQAKKFGRAKIKTGKYIDINLSAQIMSIFENSKIVDTFLISSGKRGIDTPKMETRIYNKFPRAYSKKYGLYMPNWMALVSDGKFGIHELPEWPGGYKEGTNHLGIPVSHGCVRLGVGSAEKVYNFAEIGTPVIIY